MQDCHSVKDFHKKLFLLRMGDSRCSLINSKIGDKSQLQQTEDGDVYGSDQVDVPSGPNTEQYGCVIWENALNFSNHGCRKPRGGQHMTWQKGVKEITKSLGAVGVVRLPGWGPRDPVCA
ncbi:hypothetical protein T265_15242, partial [Opisthorchis viverrini]